MPTALDGAASPALLGADRRTRTQNESAAAPGPGRPDVLSDPGLALNRPGLLLTRPARVFYLVVAAWLMGLADLSITMTYLMSVGMWEGNPVARFIIGLGSPTIVVAFKLCTMLVTSWIVLAQRRRWQAEMVAWISVAVLGVLTAHWLNYIAYAEAKPEVVTTVSLDPSYAAGTWVSLR
ncbi:MAG: DUF5658 family protein [Planctomycetota bacterium]